MDTRLQCRSHHSFLEGASDAAELVEAAARAGVRHLALTDRAGVYAAVEFCRRAEAAGLHPIVGAAVPAGADGEAVVLVRDAEGYADLCRELTALHLDPACPSRPALARLAQRNWVLTGSPDLLAALLADPDRPPGLAAELADPDRPEGRRRNRALLDLARRHDLPACASHRVFFATPDGHPTHRLLTAIRRRTTLGRLTPADTAPPDAWMQDNRSLAARFVEVPETVAAATAVAESCEFRLTTGGPVLHPPYPLPDGETAYSLLWQRALAGLAGRARPLRPASVRRLQREVEVICRLGFAEYFLIVADLVAFAGSRGIPVTGRGSAAGSLTAFALGVTHVDPLALGLSFERFLNPARTDPPDIDLDFCWRRRPEVIQYLYDTYGTDRTAMLSTHVTMAGRMCLREAARAMGLPEAEIGRYTRHIPHHQAEHLEQVLRELPECRNIPHDREPFRSVVRLAARLAGRPRHLGLHPCGVVLSRVPLHRVVPLQGTAAGFAATQFEMRAAEDVGLLKIDILGQRSLTVIADTLAATGRAAADIPADDPATWRLIRSGQTMGCFQIESPGMRALLQKLQPRELETVIAASSVIRPGPSDAGMTREFILRHHGRRPVTAPHPVMERLLAGTFGIMVYQEDILRVAAAIAGVTAAEADRLRRAMSSKRSAEAMRALRDTFLARATARGVGAEAAAEIWRQMEAFSGYAFCKAHSASYALLSWQAAHLKAHHPATFLAAVLSNGGGFYGPAAYVLEARRLGVPVRLPDINRSEAACTVEGRAIRLGLSLVGGLDGATRERILAVRRERLFTSASDFLARTGVRREEAERLIRCGALDGFDFTRPELLWKLALTPKPPRSGPVQATLPLDGGGAALHPAAGVGPRIPEFPPTERLRQEAEVLGVYVSDHPLALCAAELARLDRVRAADLPRLVGRRVRLAGWPVAGRRAFTKTRQYMKFLTLDDESGVFEVVLFPETYRRWGGSAAEPPLVVTGRVREDFGSLVVEAERLTSLGAEPGAACPVPGRSAPRGD